MRNPAIGSEPRAGEKALRPALVVSGGGVVMVVEGQDWTRAAPTRDWRGAIALIARLVRHQSLAGPAAISQRLTSTVR